MGRGGLEQNPYPSQTRFGFLKYSHTRPIPIYYILYPSQWGQGGAGYSISPENCHPYSRSLSFPSLHSLLMWLHSMFDLSWSSLFFVYSLFLYHPHHCLWFIPFTSPPCSFLTLTYSRFDISLVSFLRIPLSVWFASSSHYWYYIHIRHPQVHGSRAFLYMLHFIHEGMSFLSLGIWA